VFVDAEGNLLGAAQTGGAYGDGGVFELARVGDGYASTPTLVASFVFTTHPGTNSRLVADAAGNLFGTTALGGEYGDGTIFEIARTDTGYASTITTLASFETQSPNGVVVDAAGNLFGTLNGTIYELAKTADGYADAPVTIATAPDPGYGLSDLGLDSAGDLFATTLFAGGANGQGSIVELPKTGTGYAGTTVTLASFSDATGHAPATGVLVDAKGNLFGVAEDGGDGGASGTVYELARTADGYAGTPTVIANFTDADGYLPYSLVADASGNLFGNTVYGPGDSEGGGVFEVTDSGYVPCYCAGTLIRTVAGEVAVETLRIGDQVVTHTGAIRPIRWIGSRAYDGRFIAGNRDMLPIRILAGALDGHAPLRDLLVSPHHAMFVDGVLVPAERLVNGISIVQETSVERVHYFHIELDSHDILLAEGAPAESFVDCDSRAMFHNAAEFAALYPGQDAPRWQFCAGRVEDGPALAAIWQRIAMRAGVAPSSAAGPMRGSLDQGDREGIAGWVADNDALPVALAIGVDGVEIGRVLANCHRADLEQAGIGTGRQGFRIALPSLDPARAHLVAITRASDGTSVPGSPVLLPALRRAPLHADGAAAALLAAAERLHAARHATASGARQRGA
jgi:hypothetical protein